MPTVVINEIEYHVEASYTPGDKSNNGPDAECLEIYAVDGINFNSLQRWFQKEVEKQLLEMVHDKR
jgi:hypothetical protein